MTVTVLLAVFFLFGHLPSSRGELELFTANNGDYNISINGKTWLTNAATIFKVDGAKLSSKDSTLKLVSSTAGNGSDSIGDFKSMNYNYDAKGRSVKVGMRRYSQVAAVVFYQSYEDSFSKTSGNLNDVISGFPSFRTAELDTSLGFLGFIGMMSGYYFLTIRPWTESLPKLRGGLESGPIVLFDQQDNVVIISPFNHFMAASFNHDTDTSAVYWGIMGAVDNVPKGFKYETILFYSDKGINKAMEEWGELMRATYRRDSSARFLDPTVKYVGYYTDNGAYYYHTKEPGMNFEDTILGYAQYAKEQKIPYRYLQYDDWFYPTAGSGYRATVTWDASPSVFPHGLQYLYNKTGLPVLAHNRYWSNQTTYAKQNGGRFNFIMDGENSIPDDQDFWDYLLGTAKEWGLVNYEQDWLSFQVENIRPVYESLTLGRRWLMQMGEAATRYGIYLQYCMAYPRHMLAALEIPAVSQARVSHDYSALDQWKIGITSMLSDAVGVAPFKDNFRTVTSEPGNNRTEVSPKRQAVVALLSTGPVGPGDRKGYSNATLIETMTTLDGTLLKPSKPATAIDAQIVQRAFGGSLGPVAEVWSTYSRIGEHEFGFVFASNMQNPFDLYPTHTKIKQQGDQMVFSQAEFSPVAMSPRVFDANHPLQLTGCDGDNMCLYYTSPVFSARGKKIIFIGEKDKIVHVSPVRVASISEEDSDLQVTLKGTPGEMFQFGACPAVDGTADCFYFNCLIDGNGFALWSLAKGNCQ